MPAQVFGPRWHAVSGQIVRAGAEQGVAGAELAGNQGRVEYVGDAQGDIDALFDQIDAPVGKLEIDLNLGIAREKVDHRRHQENPPDGGRAGDAHRPARFGMAGIGDGFQFVDFGEHVLAAQQAGLAGIGQAQAAGGPVQQAFAEPGFEFGEIARDHGARHV